MRTSQNCSGPFDMLVDPEAVLRALAGSNRLECLKRKVFRPLDRAAGPAVAPARDGTGLDEDSIDAAEGDPSVY